MPSGQTVDKLATEMKVTQYLSGNASVAKDIAWVDMADYSGILVSCTAAALTGVGVTVFRILANAASDGSGTDGVVVAHAVGSAPDAAGDYLFLECTAEQIADLAARDGNAYRYVSVNITCANAADNIVVTYIRCKPRFAYDGLTADYVS